MNSKHYMELPEIMELIKAADYSIKTQLKSLLKKKNIKQYDVKDILQKKNASTISKILDEKKEISITIQDLLKLCLYYRIDFYSLFPEKLNKKLEEIKDENKVNEKIFTEFKFVETSVVRKLNKILDSISNNHIVLINTWPENGQTYALWQYTQNHDNIIYLQKKSIEALKHIINSLNKDNKANKIIIIENTEKIKKEIIEEFLDFTIQHSYSLVFIGKSIKKQFLSTDLMHNVDRIEELSALTFEDKNLLLHTHFNLKNNVKLFKKIKSRIFQSGIHGIINIIRQYAA